MREFKFRCWDGRNEIMYYEQCFNMDVETSCFTRFIQDAGEIYAVEVYSDGDCAYEAICDAELMQYTGLKDKNGKEIYEGDIVQRESMAPGGMDFLGKVVYGECEYWLEKEGLITLISLFSEIDELTVLGNIYENPELLK